MAEAKLFIPHNSTQCLELPPHIKSADDFQEKYSKLPTPHLTTSYIDPDSRRPLRNEYNVISPLIKS